MQTFSERNRERAKKRRYAGNPPKGGVIVATFAPPPYDTPDWLLYLYALDKKEHWLSLKLIAAPSILLRRANYPLSWSHITQAHSIRSNIWALKEQHPELAAAVDKFLPLFVQLNMGDPREMVDASYPPLLCPYGSHTLCPHVGTVGSQEQGAELPESGEKADVSDPSSLCTHGAHTAPPTSLEGGRVRVGTESFLADDENGDLL